MSAAPYVEVRGSGPDLVLLHADSLDPDLVRETLNVILKFEQDIAAVEPQVGELLRAAAA